MVNSLMEFRLTYLRAIAKAWRDEDFRNEFVNNGCIFSALREHFDYRSPWKYSEIHVIDKKKTKWDPIKAAGWVGPNDHFILYLPAKPDKVEQEPDALAAYYELFPMLFGRDFRENAGGLTSAQQLPMGLGSGGEDFLEFGAVTLRAIALAWCEGDGEEPFEFKDALLAASQDEQDATPVLGKYLGYNNPWNFSISFKEDSNFVWDGRGLDPRRHEWVDVPSNIIKLHFPRPPRNHDKKYWSIALTSYNNTGPEYPFSCV